MIQSVCQILSDRPAEKGIRAFSGAGIQEAVHIQKSPDLWIVILMKYKLVN